MQPYYDSRTQTFNLDYTHTKGECVYCDLSFAHVHPKGTGVKDFVQTQEIKIDWDATIWDAYEKGKQAGRAETLAEVRKALDTYLYNEDDSRTLEEVFGGMFEGTGKCMV